MKLDPQRKHDIEVIAFGVVFALFFIGCCAADLIDTQILQKYEWEMLWLVVLPIMAWYGRIVIKESKMGE